MSNQWDRFVVEFTAMEAAVGANSAAHGFWDGEQNKGLKIALIHSELSEALEAIRSGNPPDKHCPNFTSEEVEMADAVIRIMDYAAMYDLRLGDAIVAKHEFNKTRPHKHGKAF